jgi:uncharacterized glyoxalase superfamily protein PhnB
MDTTTNLRVEGLTPFVPAKDFDLSSRFYRDLGFSAVASIENAIRFAARVLAEPHDQEGGRMMQFADPAGVLWHIRQE